MERGLSFSDIKKMQLGQLVDFVADYNERQKEGKRREERQKKVVHYRLATPEETSAFSRS